MLKNLNFLLLFSAFMLILSPVYADSGTEFVQWLKSSHRYGGACVRISASKTIYAARVPEGTEVIVQEPK